MMNDRTFFTAAEELMTGKLLTDRDVMDKTSIKELEDLLFEVRLRKMISTIGTEERPFKKVQRLEYEYEDSLYVRDHDITFIMKHTWDVTDEPNTCDRVLIASECVGWYCGEPSEELTCEILAGDSPLKATY